MRVFIEVVAGRDGHLEISLGFQQVGRVLDESIDRGGAEFFADWQAKMARQRLIQKVLRLEPERAEEIVWLDSKCQSRAAVHTWIGIHLDVPVVSGIVERL